MQLCKKRAYNKMVRTRKLGDILSYKKIKNSANHLIKQAKLAYWNNYCYEINRQTSVAKMWDTVKSINRPQKTHSPSFSNNADAVQANEETANKMAAHFATYNNYSVDVNTKEYKSTTGEQLAN